MADNTTYELQVSITIIKRPIYCGERLTVNESSNIPVGNFLEACAVLGRFHELTEAMRNGSSRPKG